jgi:hypothetical protein
MSYLVSTIQAMGFEPILSNIGKHVSLDAEEIAFFTALLHSVALPLFRLGHIPMIGEWVALPLLELAGSVKPGDAAWEEILYPVAHRLLQKCDAVLRLEGASKGADEDFRIALERGLNVYYRVGDVPMAD